MIDYSGDRGGGLRRTLRGFVVYGLFPCLLYSLALVLLTAPLIRQFSSSFFSDRGDGFQMVWNVWWVNKAVTELHCSPWYTYDLHYPHGTSLLAHTLHPYKGFLGVALLRFLSLVQTYNALIILSFVMGGVTAFWLARDVVRSWWPSLLTGFIFSFSSYHFAHATGHMQLVSLEWIPLFVLLWRRLMLRPGFWLAIATSLVLFLVILCDYYYFLFCVMTAAILTAWHAHRIRSLSFLVRPAYVGPLILFMVCTVLTSGALAIALIRLSSSDVLVGAHNPSRYGLDPLALVVPGVSWHFSDMTRFLWMRQKGSTAEHSVNLGISVIALLIYAWRRRKESLAPTDLGVWFAVLVFFAVFAIGPRFTFAGVRVTELPMPYCFLTRVLPFMRLSGVPVRMMVMVFLAAGVLSGIAAKDLWRRGAWGRAGVVLLIALLLVEYLPAPLARSSPEVPEYVHVLKCGGQGGVFDVATEPGDALYYQTVHGKPMAFGYISREPASVQARDAVLRSLYRQGDWLRLRDDFGFRFLVVPFTRTALCLPEATIKMVYEGDGVRVYDLGQILVSTAQREKNHFAKPGLQ